MKKLLLLIFLLSFFHLSFGQKIRIKASDTTICRGMRVTFTATDSGIIYPHHWWIVNSDTIAQDWFTFFSDTLETGDRIHCVLTNGLHDTVYAISDTIIMTVDTVMPNAGVITGVDTTMCVWDTVTLAASVPGGVWVSGSAYAAVTNGIVTGIRAPGPVRFLIHAPIYYIAQTGACFDTALKKVTVMTEPDAGFSLPHEACLGYSKFSALFAPSTLVSTYGNVTVSGGLLFGLKLGKDSVYNIATNQCGTHSYGKWITIIDKPKVPNFHQEYKTVCVGDTVVLFDTSLIGTLDWRVSNGNISTIFVPGFGGHTSSPAIFRASKPGIDTIRLGVWGLCGSSVGYYYLTIENLKPIEGDQVVCKDYSIVLTDSSTTGVWSTSNPDIATVDSYGKVSGFAEGVAVISYSNPVACYRTKRVAVVRCEEEAVLFPNPSRNEITVQQLAYHFFETVAVLNMTGGEVTKQGINGTYAVVDIHALPVGLYFVRLTGKRGVKMLRFLKE